MESWLEDDKTCEAGIENVATRNIDAADEMKVFFGLQLRMFVHNGWEEWAGW